MNQVKISVLMPAYNVENFIGEAIQSVLDQSLKDFELIIINDGSTDATEKVIRSFSDERIVLKNQNNAGIAAALNTGLYMAKAEYIVRFDADDICYTHRLVKQYQFMIENPHYVIAGCAADYIDQSGEYVFTHYPSATTDHEIRKSIHRTCPFIHSGVIFKKQFVLKHGGYNEHAHSFEDHLLWQALIKEGKAMNFSEPLIQVRLNPESITVDEQWRPKEFHRIKNKVITENRISKEEGVALLQIIQDQNNSRLKESAYYSLLAKKFLWNNHQPEKARANLTKVIAKNKFHWKSYCFYLLSYLPASILQKGYKYLKPQPVYLIGQRNRYER